MHQTLEVALGSPWAFLGSCIFLFLGSFSIALSFYWLTRYRELRAEERAAQQALQLYQMAEELSKNKPPFN